MNILAGKGLFFGLAELKVQSQHDSYMKRHIAFSREHHFGSWLPYVIDCTVAPKPLVTLIDYRLSNGLTERARKFVFSMMNVAIRGSSPEYEQAQFAVLDLPATEFQVVKKKRAASRRDLRIHLDVEQYYSLDDLGDMIDRIYRMFDEVLVLEQRKAA